MPDWTKSMQQTFEYYKVNPDTWLNSEKLDWVTESTITRDYSKNTKESATMTITSDIEECYVRILLKTIQNGVTERFSLGTFLAQSPSMKFDGKVNTISIDAYSPLLELNDDLPPLGFTIQKENKILDGAYNCCLGHVRAPIVKTTDDDKILVSDFTAYSSDTWLTYTMDLLSQADYYLNVDEMGRIIFEPNIQTQAMQPVWIYSDDNSSILCPEISTSRDLYGIPNVVEVVYSSNNITRSVTVENNDAGSAVSIPRRGRRVVYRDTSPSISGTPDLDILTMYAEKLLESKSSLEYTLTYTHGYCPVRVGDCVMLNYERAGITNVRAKVTQQTINCTTGCQVEETVTYTKKYWERG